MKSLRAAVAAALMSTVVFALPAGAAGPDIEASVHTISRFKTGSDATRFGKLEFLGGLQFSSNDSMLQSLSAIRFRPDGKSFVSVLDTGHWLTGQIERDAEGRLSGLSRLQVSPLLYRGGRPGSKFHSDAEGLALRKGEAVVSFEQLHRIETYPDPGFEASGPTRTIDFVFPRRELRMNAGMETLALSPEDSPLKGSLVTVTEHSLDQNGNMFAAILEGPLKGVFKIVRHDPYDATDGAFLPDGDFLLLERRFSFLGGLGMRIRRFDAAQIRPDALIDGEILLEADMTYAIDNMEGLDVIEAPDGRPHLILVSDDNGNFLQRNLMLEFRLAE